MLPKLCLFLVQMLFAKKKTFLQKSAILTFLDLYSLTRCNHVNSDAMLARKSSKRAVECFFFRGFLPVIDSEIMAHFRRNMALR